MCVRVFLLLLQPKRVNFLEISNILKQKNVVEILSMPEAIPIHFLIYVAGYDV